MITSNPRVQNNQASGIYDNPANVFVNRDNLNTVNVNPASVDLSWTVNKDSSIGIIHSQNYFIIVESGVTLTLTCMTNANSIVLKDGATLIYKPKNQEDTKPLSVDIYFEDEFCIKSSTGLNLTMKCGGNSFAMISDSREFSKESLIDYIDTFRSLGEIESDVMSCYSEVVVDHSPALLAEDAVYETVV